MSASSDKANVILDHLRANQGRPSTYGELRKLAGGSSRPIIDLVNAGKIVKLAMGNYGLPDRDASHDLIQQLALRHPEGVICLSSAASFHGLSTVNPQLVHIAFPYGKSVPRHRDVPLQGYRWNEKNFDYGVENYKIGAVDVRMTNPARTVIDLIYRIGRTGEIEEAMESLATFINREKPADLIKLASRMGRLDKIAPYVQSGMISDGGLRHG